MCDCASWQSHAIELCGGKGEREVLTAAHLVEMGKVESRSSLYLDYLIAAVPVGRAFPDPSHGRPDDPSIELLNNSQDPAGECRMHLEQARLRDGRASGMKSGDDGSILSHKEEPGAGWRRRMRGKQSLPAIPTHDRWTSASLFHGRWRPSGLQWLNEPLA